MSGELAFHHIVKVRGRGGGVYAFFLLIFCAMLFFSSLSVVQAETAQKSIMRAAFLGKLVEFIDLSKPEVGSAPFILTVLGETPIKDSLKTLYNESVIKKRPVQLRFISNLAQVGKSDMLFIAASEKKRLAVVVDSLAGKGVLTVGASPGFAKKGVHVNLYDTAQGTIHFEINRKRMVADGLTPHLRLLELTKIVN